MLAEHILAQAAAASEVTMKEVRSGRRWPAIVRAKQATIYVLRTRRTPPSYWSAISRAMSCDNKTAQHHFNRAVKRRETEPDFRKLTDELLELATSPATEAA